VRWAFLALLLAADPPIERLETLDSLKQAVHPSSRPLLVHFWALWCPSCVEELPRQVQLARALKKDGVSALFVDLDGFDKAENVKGRIRLLGASGVAGQAMLSTELNTDSVTPLFSAHWNGLLPATFAVLADGGIAAEVIGPLTPDAERRLRAAFSDANDAGRR
jgi:thiol-disulfide isomerase/thioredoxin